MERKGAGKEGNPNFNNRVVCYLFQIRKRDYYAEEKGEGGVCLVLEIGKRERVFVRVVLPRIESKSVKNKFYTDTRPIQ